MYYNVNLTPIRTSFKELHMQLMNDMYIGVFAYLVWQGGSDSWYLAFRSLLYIIVAVWYLTYSYYYYTFSSFFIWCSEHCEK